MDTPPIIDGDIENTERYDEECCRPLGLEANGDHNASDEAEQRKERAPDAPLALDNKAKEKEDKEDAAREKEAKSRQVKICVTGERSRSNALFSAVSLTDTWDTSEQLFARHHRVTEYHEKTSNDGKVAKEEGHVKNETVAKPLDDNDSEKARDSVFCMALRYDRTRANKHGLTTSRNEILYEKQNERALTMTLRIRKI